jgi:hypothetical protein
MSNVIHVEFGKKNVTEQQRVLENPSSLAAYPGNLREQANDSFHDLYELTSVPDMSSLTAYLDSLRAMGAEDEDLIEVIEAINDMDVYFAADDEVKAFADGWLQNIV